MRFSTLNNRTKIDITMRLLKRIALLLFLLLIVFVAHVLISTGFFRTVENKFAGAIIKKVSLPGAEDIMVSLSDSFALISSTNRAVFPPEAEEHGGLYFMDLKSGNYHPVHLSAAFKGTFAPHGISMLKMDSIYKVMAINHTAKGHSIEVFKLEGKELHFEKTLRNPAMISPNDLVLIDEHRFYFTNDHGYTEGIGNFLEEYGGLSVSNVVYFDGVDYKEVANGIAYANGINFDSDRKLLFVASPRSFLVKVYTKNPDGSLSFIEDIPCGTGVDNIEFDPEGNLWIGSHPNLLRFNAYSKGKKATAPSEIIRISYRSQGDYTVDKVFVDDGTAMSGASVATPFGDLILAGNVMDSEFLILQQESK